MLVLAAVPRAVRSCVLLSVFCSFTTTLAVSTEIVIELPNAKSSETHETIYGVRQNLYPMEPRVKSLNFAASQIGVGRYNPHIKAMNPGIWWFFCNTPSADIRDLARDAVTDRLQLAILIGLSGWIPKDHTSCSFPKHLYQDQDKTHWADGNGVRPDGTLIDADPNTANQAVGPELAEMIVERMRPFLAVLKQPVFILDGAPERWFIIDRDVHPQPTSYDDYLTRYLAMAKSIRRTTPNAYIVGPGILSLKAMEYSAHDLRGRWSNYRFGQDRAQHGGVPFLEWFVRQVQKEEQEFGDSLLDGLSFENYANADWAQYEKASPEHRQAILDSTRTLWDTSYQHGGFYHENIYWLPRLKALINNTKPSLGIVVSSFQIPGHDDLASSLATVETLALYGHYGVRMALSMLPISEAVRPAWQLMANYDGKRHRFRGINLKNSHGVTADLSVYTVLDQDTRRLLVLTVNKSTSNSQDISISSKLLQQKLGSWRRAQLYTLELPMPVQVRATAFPLPYRENIKLQSPPLSARLLSIDY